MAAGMQVGAVDGARAADGGMGRRGGDGIHSDCPSVYAQLRRAQTLQKSIKNRRGQSLRSGQSARSKEQHEAPGRFSVSPSAPQDLYDFGLRQSSGLGGRFLEQYEQGNGLLPCGGRG